MFGIRNETSAGTIATCAPLAIDTGTVISSNKLHAETSLDRPELAAPRHGGHHRVRRIAPRVERAARRTLQRSRAAVI